MIRAILACDDNWGIGKNNDLPWPHNPADLKWFKESTDGGVVVMGRNTWDSLPKQPLPNRRNVILSSSIGKIRSPFIEVIKPDIFGSRINVLEQEDAPVWFIGGAHLINSYLRIIDEIWLSRIAGNYNWDVFLPRTAIELAYELQSSESNNGVHIEKWVKV